MLGVSEIEMEDFLNKYMGSTSDVIYAVSGIIVLLYSRFTDKFSFLFSTKLN